MAHPRLPLRWLRVHAAVITLAAREERFWRGRGRRREQSQKDHSRLSASSGNILNPHQTDHLPAQQFLLLPAETTLNAEEHYYFKTSSELDLEKPPKGCCFGRLQWEWLGKEGSIGDCGEAEQLGREPFGHGCVPVQGPCPSWQVEAGGSCKAAGRWGWSLLSGGGSINPWERLDQWKKSKWEFSSSCSDLESNAALQLGLGPGFLVYESRAFVKSSKMGKCKAGAPFVWVHAVFVQSCLVSVHTHFTGASTSCVGDEEGRHYNTLEKLFFLLIHFIA